MAPAKPPRPPTTSGRRVEATASRIRATARSPASTSTPATRYASRGACSRAPTGGWTATAGVPTSTRAPPPTVRSRRASPLVPSATGPDDLLQDELAARGVVRHGLRVLAIETGEAEPVVRQVERGENAADGKVAQRVGPDEGPDLLDGVGRGDQLRLDLRVDPVEAGVVDGRRADPNMDLCRAGPAEQVDDRARRRTADDRIVHDDQPPTTNDLAKRRKLHGDASLAHRLGGLDERAARVPRGND